MPARPAADADSTVRAKSQVTRVHVSESLVHKRTDTQVASCQDRYAPRRPDCGANHMLFIVGVAVALLAVVIVPRMRVLGGVNSANLGWMSEQWLAEHRASHSL